MLAFTNSTDPTTCTRHIGTFGGMMQCDEIAAVIEINRQDYHKAHPRCETYRSKSPELWLALSADRYYGETNPFPGVVEAQWLMLVLDEAERHIRACTYAGGLFNNNCDEADCQPLHHVAGIPRAKIEDLHITANRRILRILEPGSSEAQSREETP